MNAGGDLGQLHEILTIRAYIDVVRIDRVLVPADRPLQSSGCLGGGDGEAVTDTRLDLSTFFVIVPGYELQIGKRLA